VLNPFISVINQLISEPQASLLNGILFGVKSQMPKELFYALRDTGVLHVIALSGMNISILIDILAKLTLFLGRRVSIIVTILSIFGFVMFVGPSSSVVRAAIMGAMTLVAIYFGKRAWSLLSLFLASGIMLLVRPEWLKEISFQLSFLATLGVILANNVIKRERSLRLSKQLIFGFKENLAMTLSAQIFTMPIIVYNFHRISLIGPVANLAIGWVVQPIMILGFIVAIVGWVWLPLGYIPAWIVWVPLTYFINVIEVLATIPGASLQLQ